MSARLTCDEVAVLNNLKNTVSPTASENSNALNRLFMYGLAARQPSGKVIVTTSGERFLFQKECCSVLRALSQNEASTPPPSVMKWLKAAGFVTEVGSAQTLKITRRGELWLASFDLEGPIDVADTHRAPSKPYHQKAEKVDLRFNQY